MLSGFAFCGPLGATFLIYWLAGCCFLEKSKGEEMKRQFRARRLIVFALIFTCFSFTVALIAGAVQYCVIYERTHCEPRPPPTSEYWVRQMADPAHLNASAPAFPVAVPNEHKDIAHLKKAIKTETDVDYRRNPALIRIFKQVSGSWAEQTRPEAALQSSTVDAPYGFLLPQ